MEYLRVKNWEKFQHYKDRNPPWIKLHFEILSSHDWVILDDAGKLLAVACMLIASRHEGNVPNNPEYISRLTYIKKINLKPLIECGFLEDASGCSQMLADACPSVSVSVSSSVSVTNKDECKIFEKFWESFPRQRRGSRDHALRAYLKAMKRATEEEIHAGTIRYAGSDEVIRGFGKGAAGWLNDDRWANDYRAPQPTVNGKRTYADSIASAAQTARRIINEKENLRAQEDR